jgi:hypothetical protein
MFRQMMFDYKTEPTVLTLLQKQRVVCTFLFQFYNVSESVTMAQLELLSTFIKIRDSQLSSILFYDGNSTIPLPWSPP